MSRDEITDVDSQKIETPAKNRQLGPQLSEEERRINEDYQWCLQDESLQKAYSGMVVAAYKKRIWGCGPNHLAAWLAAQKAAGCPEKKSIAFVTVPGYFPPRN